MSYLYKQSIQASFSSIRVVYFSNQETNPVTLVAEDGFLLASVMLVALGAIVKLCRDVKKALCRVDRQLLTGIC